MRLLFIGHSSALLGAERSLADIVSGAVRDGHDVTVVLPGSGPLVGVLEAVGATVATQPVRAWMGTWHRVPPVGLTRLAQSRATVRALEDLIRQCAADAVVTNTSVVRAGAEAARAVGVPHVWIVRESLRDNPQLRSLLPKPVIARRILDAADVLCTVSPYVERQLYELAGRSHPLAFRVNPNPAEGHSPEPPKPHRRPVTILLPGFFSREKGQHRVMIGAFLARRRGSDLEIRLVGRGRHGFTQVLRALRLVLGLRQGVVLVPWTDDLDGEYARAHFVLSTSRNEAFGRTVVEAFARARPVIGLDRGATATLLEGGGGILVTPGTVRQLGTALAAVADMEPHEYEMLGRRAADRGEEFRRGPSQYDAFRAALASVLPAVGRANT